VGLWDLNLTRQQSDEDNNKNNNNINNNTVELSIANVLAQQL
jgi:hypothetical protein